MDDTTTKTQKKMMKNKQHSINVLLNETKNSFALPSILYNNMYGLYDIVYVVYVLYCTICATYCNTGTAIATQKRPTRTIF